MPRLAKGAIGNPEGQVVDNLAPFARGMNSAGEMSPRSGCDQRIQRFDTARSPLLRSILG